MLKRSAYYWKLWGEMVSEQGLLPNCNLQRKRRPAPGAPPARRCLTTLGTMRLWRCRRRVSFPARSFAGLSLRCACSQNLQLAEALTDIRRARKEMTCATYKTLKSPRMKPDPVKYGSQMKLPMKAGRTELAQEILNFSSTDEWLCAVLHVAHPCRGPGWQCRASNDYLPAAAEIEAKHADPMALRTAIDTCAPNKGIDRAECPEECSRNAFAFR